MHVRCDNKYKTGAEDVGGRGTVVGQPMLFECMGICVLSWSLEFEMRVSLLNLVLEK